MKKLTIFIGKVPVKVPVNVTIMVDETLYSDPKLYVAKSGGKPTCAPGKHWHVYYYFTHPSTGLRVKHIDKCDINKLKTVEERMAMGNAWVRAYQVLLAWGFSPYDPQGLDPKQFEAMSLEAHIREMKSTPPQKDWEKTFTIRTGFLHAYDNKLGSWKSATASDYKTRMNVFLEWAELNGIDQLPISELQDIHLIAFLNWLIKPAPIGRGVSRTSQDNYKRGLSGLLGKLVTDKILPKNPIEGIPTTKDDPVKNTPFTGYEMREIRDYLLQHDRQLYHFLQLVIYTFLRPREIIRLRVEDVNLRDKYLTVDTKTKRRKVKKLIGPILDYFTQINITAQPSRGHIFTNTDIIEVWDAGEKAKVDHFGERFKKVKAHFKFGAQYGIYSARHTAALDLYNSFTKDGLNHREAVLKLMPIIGHDNEETTEKYLRDIGAMLPKDYGEFYTLNF